MSDNLKNNIDKSDLVIYYNKQIENVPKIKKTSKYTKKQGDM